MLDEIDINQGETNGQQPPPLPAVPNRPVPQANDDPFSGLDVVQQPTSGQAVPADNPPIFPSMDATNTGQDAEYTMSADTQNSFKDDETKSLASICGLILLSFGLMVQSSIECDRGHEGVGSKKCTSEYGYAVSVAVIGLVMAVALLVMYKYAKDKYLKVIPYMAVFSTVWWGFGTAVCTFSKPFTDTGNGYFALWAGFAMSFFLTTLTVSGFRGVVEKAQQRALAGTIANKYMTVIFIMSVCVFIASLVEASEMRENERIEHQKKKSSSQDKWGIFCGIISAVLVLVYLALEYLKATRGFTRTISPKYFSAFLALWWLFGVGVLTFDKPFTTTGNGYFATWGAFLASLYLCYIYFMKVSGEGEGQSQDLEGQR